ncbi:ABC transporter ATP-binding protein [Sporosarcina pasteurii]|uniref:Bicarbonate transport ATP-binding protein CmpD n=1 Tax=Sporosarcina pasteurii TaxID=1474 RepID=A0A380BCD2_SPOPA|nr:ABC transporter ATP-binding protein [Sporosarcina pasteurii]MDS9472874.1 ABC transporter ATP-binding protein [Sporosarcina pasteurii]QBQ06424.1 ABC transporter ATP-binding protein [Sporosarcina pasteurii]SUI98607.1 Bicarbonate transport ATP-binding protein CmpD [Sporosarcina pasteurii]
MGKKAKIEITNLTKAFYKKQNSVTALDDISLTIEDGEFICLVGPSGCGKTTLLRILAELETPSVGKFTIMTENEGRPLQSMVFQERGIIPWLTVEENVEFGLKMRHLPKDVIRERTAYYLKKTGLDKFSTLYPKELSGGMKQRVSIARAFANDPEILLMDEPFAALDEQNKFILQEELLSIWEETGKTVLFITHSIDEALLLSDRILLMSAQPGKIIHEIRIDLPRPRKVEDIRENPEMAAKFVEIWQHLQEEVQNSRKEKD